ncbi:MAG: hypothetical protein KGZ96_07465 [Clostridia bacterium]|jgi:hypothetical protein|nr:hypothetical protein [Clostridia bacterium]
MIKVLSWILVFCIALYFFGIMGLVFISPSLIPNMITAVMVLAFISGGLLLILLIRERIK